MTYDADKLVLEEIPSFAAFVRLVRPTYAKPEIRTRRAPSLPGYELVEVHDAVTGEFLGNWEEDFFDFAGASEAVVDKLDERFRKAFGMKKRKKRPYEPNGQRSVGRDFESYKLPLPTKQEMRPRPIQSLEDFYRLITYAEIEVQVRLGGPLYSTQNFEAYKNHILQHSMVDGSVTQYTKRQFEKSLYAKAISGGKVALERVL